MDNNVVEIFQKKYPTKAEKEKALNNMTNDQIDELINASNNIQAKIFYSTFKKQENDRDNLELQKLKSVEWVQLFLKKDQLKQFKVKGEIMCKQYENYDVSNGGVQTDD